jgi:hypothetical protein
MNNSSTEKKPEGMPDDLWNNYLAEKKEHEKYRMNHPPPTTAEEIAANFDKNLDEMEVSLDDLDEIEGTRSVGQMMAIAIDYRTGKVLYRNEGTEEKTYAKEMVEMARRAGQRLSIEHNHPMGDMVSPEDVGVLLCNSDVVEQVGAHTDNFRYTVRKCAKFAPTKDEMRAIVEQLTRYSAQLKTGEMTFAQWEKKILEWEGYGWLGYEKLAER